MLTPSIVVTDRYQEQSLEGEAWKVGASGGDFTSRRTSPTPGGQNAATSRGSLMAGKTLEKRISDAVLG
jgi:hypothetical protein